METDMFGRSQLLLHYTWYYLDYMLCGSEYCTDTYTRLQTHDATKDQSVNGYSDVKISD